MQKQAKGGETMRCERARYVLFEKRAAKNEIKTRRPLCSHRLICSGPEVCVCVDVLLTHRTPLGRLLGPTVHGQGVRY